MPPATEASVERGQVARMPDSDTVLAAIKEARATECKDPHPACEERAQGMVLWVMTGRTALKNAGAAIDMACPDGAHDTNPAVEVGERGRAEAPGVEGPILSAARLLVARCRGVFARNSPSNIVGRWHDETKAWTAKPEHARKNREVSPAR